MTPRKALPSAPANTASGYVRLSREAMESNLSLKGMEDDIRAEAARQGLALVALHIDDGFSGAIRNRPEFMAWLNDAKEGRASHLIAWHVDRMTREGVNVAASILDTIEGKDPETGKTIREPVALLDTKGLDSRGDESSFRMRFVIAAEIARAERERSRDRARNSQRRARAAGRWPGGPTPFGFHAIDNPNGAGRVLAVNEPEAALLRECAARILAGTNLSAVVRYANSKDGLAPRRAKMWSRVTMRQSLTGASASGPILSADESAALRKRLAQVPDARKGQRMGARLLSGLLRCQSCDEVMSVCRRTDGSVTYRCQTGREQGACPRPVAISALPLEAYITGEFLRRHGDMPHMVRRAVVTGAAAVEAAEKAVADALADLAAEATAAAFERLQKAQAQEKEARAIPSETVVSLTPTGKTFAEEWEDGELADRRELLAANLSDIIIRPGRRGPRGLDPERVLMLSIPSFPVEAGDSGDFQPGRVAG